MLKKIIWYIVLSISLIATLIFMSGFVSSLAITTASKKSIEPVPIPSAKPDLDPNFYNILVLGDSLAKGTGDEKGKGFASYFRDLWQPKILKEIKPTNLAVNGDVSSGLLKIVESPTTLSSIKSSQIIFISIGGNEITKFTGTDVVLSPTEIKNTEVNYLNNLKEIYKVIRTTNNSCMIVFIGLYNPFDKHLTTDKINFLNEWNYQTEQFVSTDINSIFIPTYDLFKYNLDDYISIDNFHPNSLGYQAISNRIFDALKNYK